MPNREPIYKSLSAASRALARNPAVRLQFKGNESLPDINTSESITMPSPGVHISKEKLRLLRGEADLAALGLRYHRQNVHAALRPNTAKAAALFDALERARIELLGSEHWQ